MKKIIVMLAAVALAAVAQAASITWTAVDANAKGVYMYNTPLDDKEHVTLNWDANSAYFIETLMFGTWEEQLSMFAAAALYAFDAQGNGTFTYVENQKNIYGIIVATYDDANVTPGGAFKAYLVDVSEFEANNYTFDLSSTTLHQSGNFGGGAAGNIPEPTSGLLLLLGMAGLALKRSRLR